MSHTITLSSSGAGTVAAVRVTYTTTVDLGGATAKSNSGRCTVAARTVSCDLGDVRFPAMPTITITGTVDPRATTGTLVQNRVSVDSSQFTTKSANHVASNAYLISSTASGQPSRPASQNTAAAASSQVTPRATNRAPMVTTVLALAVAALVAGLLLWRRRQSRLSATSPGKADT